MATCPGSTALATATEPPFDGATTGLAGGIGALIGGRTAAGVGGLALDGLNAPGPEKMLLSAAALAAAAGLGAGTAFGFSRCFTRAIRSCGWKGLRNNSSALTANARSATARLTTPDISTTGVFDSSA